MDRPSINIVICTYNNAKLLDRTLSTIAKQQVDPSIEWSVLVVDNNSTDETSAVVRRIAFNSSIPGLRVVHEPQQGLSYARRRAVRESLSQLIAFVDDDCLLSPDWVQQAVSFCQSHPKAGAVGGKVQLLWEVPPDEALLQFGGYLAQQDRGDLPLQMPSSGPTYLVGAGLVLRRTPLLASGWVEKMALTGRLGLTLTAGDDSEMVLRIRNAGYEIWYNPAMQLNHYIPQRRISVDYLCRLLRGIGQSRAILYALGHCLKPTFAVRFRLLTNSVRYLAQLLLSIAYRNILRGFTVPRERQIYLYDAIGNVEGAMQFLLKKNEQFN